MVRTTLTIGAICLLATSTAQASTVAMTKADGGATVKTPAYEVTIGRGGGLESIMVGGVELMKAHKPWNSANFMTKFVKPGCVGLIRPSITGRQLEVTGVNAAKGEVVASGDDCTLRYVFRETDFDLFVTKTKGEGYLMFFPSDNVLRSLDLLTDKPVDMATNMPIWVSQEGMRWVTKQGPVLQVWERPDGYAACVWWGSDGKAPKRAAAFSSSPRPKKFVFRPIARPTAPDALQFTVTADDPGFMLPAGPKGQFTILATNVSADPIAAEVEFQILDFLTHAVVARKTSTLTVAAGAQQPLDADIQPTNPGPWRGAIVVNQRGKPARVLKWIFVYDFPNYKPETTRQPDFKAFWKKTLDELAKTPMDAKLTLNEKRSSKTHVTYEVSLGTLNGERVWAWYSTPRKPGKYPVIYQCPPTGLDHPHISQSSSRGDYVLFYMAIHGYDLHLSDVAASPSNDPRRRYLTAGLKSPETARWRWIYASLYRGMDFLRTRPEVDPKRIGVVGSSQGGGLSIVLAGLDPTVAFLSPTCGGLCRLDWTIKHNVCYWPFTARAKPKGQTMGEFLKTISYFDAANFAPDITCPTVAHVQLLDWVTTSGGQIAALAHLKTGQVEVLADPWEGHGASSPRCRARYRKARQRFLAGKPPVVKPSK